MRTLGTVAIAAVAAGVVAAAGAPPAFAGQLVRQADTPTNLAGDGWRWVAWEPREGITRIYDARRGRRADVRTPVGCSDSPRGAGVQSVGPTYLLWTCIPDPDALPRPLLLRLRDRRIFEPRGVDAVFLRRGPALGVRWQSAGRRWIRFNYQCEERCRNRYLNIASGEDRPEPPGPRRFTDLDTAALLFRPCSPLRKPSVFHDGRAPYLNYDFEARVGMIYESSGLLRARGCGTRRSTVLARDCFDFACFQLRVRHGRVTFVDRGYLWRYRFGTGSRTRLARLPAFRYARVAQTARGAFVALSPPRTGRPRLFVVHGSRR